MEPVWSLTRNTTKRRKKRKEKEDEEGTQKGDNRRVERIREEV